VSIALEVVGQELQCDEGAEFGIFGLQTIPPGSEGGAAIRGR